MRYRNIPGTKLMPSVLCMGGGPLSREGAEAEVFELLDTFYELGGNFIDSANVYGKWLPSGENVCDLNIGRWLKARGMRNEIVVTSKGGHPPLSAMTRPRLRHSELNQDLDESLEALGTATIDLYYLHRDDPDMPVDEIMDSLNEFVHDGRIRYFAASNWHPARIDAAQRYAKKAGRQGFCANQLMWSLGVPDDEKIDLPMLFRMDREAMAYHRESRLAAVAYESQARGFFQKHALGAVPDKLMERYGNAETMTRFDRAVALAKQLGVKLGDVTLGYVLNQSFASYAIVGGHTAAQLRDSTTAADLLLTPTQIAFLEGEN